MALIQHWKCQDNAASTVVVATVGTDAALVGGDNTSVKASAGPGTALTNAFDLNGSDDAVDVSAAAISFAGGTALSLALWFWRDGATSNQLLGTSGTGNNSVSFQSATVIRVRTVVSSDFTVASVSTGAWHHLLVTRTTGNSVRLFVDGVESSTGALSNTATVSYNRIGLSNASFFDGRICDVRVYNSDESANVAAIMAEKDTAGGGQPAIKRMGGVAFNAGPFGRLSGVRGW